MWRVLLIGLYVSAACAAVVEPAWILRRDKRARSARQVGTTVTKTKSTDLGLGRMNLTHVEFTREDVVYTLLTGFTRPHGTKDQACNYLDDQGGNVTGTCVAPWLCPTHFDSYAPGGDDGSFVLTKEGNQHMCIDRQLYWGYCCPKPPIGQPGTTKDTP